MYNNYSIFDRNQTKNSYNNCIELKQSAVLGGVNSVLDSYTNKLKWTIYNIVVLLNVTKLNLNLVS